ncbi:MAG: TonB-dependent receptor, partial [Epsilonproteobacteria bacterium]|nr:TonB-dependent receptor [Campylobacterota bacterium]
NPDVDYKAYTVVDLSVDYDISKQLNIYAKVDNVLDKEYQTVTGYATSQRAYYLGFRYKIK